jgi:alanyl-tRNA synthetase
MRRIEALTGDGADAWVSARLELLQRAGSAAGATSIESLPERLAALQDELKDARRRARAGVAGAIPKAAELAARAIDVGRGASVVTFSGPFESIEAMKGVARDLRGLLPSGVIALGLDSDEPQVFVTVSDDLVGQGVAAGGLVQRAATLLGGRGGGRPEMAQGKGTRRDGLAAALDEIREAVRSQLG